MKLKTLIGSLGFIMLLMYANSSNSQTTSTDSTWKKSYKNIIRYNISGALLFGFGNYLILGYERMVNPHQSFSINVGAAALPKLVSINTDSFHLQKDLENKGFNLSADYRFYLRNENKYYAPHGVYIGPYISYNSFNRKNDWDFQRNSSEQKLITTDTKFKILSAGVELGYQFVFWKRVTLDMVLIGPGVSVYNLKVKANGNLTEDQKQNLNEALIDLISQKFPGMNYVLADKELDANGGLKTTSMGFRYLIHIGFAF